MAKFSDIPKEAYGVLQQDQFNSIIGEVAEQVKRLGFAVLDSGLTSEELKNISDDFNRTRERYISSFGKDRLKSADEYHTIRAPLLHGGPTFIKLVMNPNLVSLLKTLILGKFVLNQQNGVINPPGETYNQGFWHRDLPYQHFVSSSPLAINALFCVDDFTLENGSTFVLPASHKSAAFPSVTYVEKNAFQVEAKAGQYIILDCMLFHSGGFNRTDKERRAVNHVFNMPFFKQQINLPANMSTDGLTAEEQEILGFNYMEPASIENYISSRTKKNPKK